MKIKGKSIEEIFKHFNLEEHSLYKVRVRSSQFNPEHIAYLFTGFKTGGYTTVYSNNYETPTPLEGIHSIKFIKKLDTKTE